MSFSFDGSVAAPKPYWELSFAPEDAMSPDQAQRLIADALSESVQAHLTADVPVGALLSGGVDSTLVLAEMIRQSDSPVPVFTIAFEEASHSELTFARQAAERLGAVLHSESVQPNVERIVGELVAHHGEPFADTSSIPTWCVSRLARRHVPVVLSGDGADEAFAGYHRYERWTADHWLRDVRSALLHPKRLVRRFMRRCAHRMRRVDYWQSHFVGSLSLDARQRLWRPEHRQWTERSIPAFDRAAEQLSSCDRLTFAQQVDRMTYLPGDILRKVDIASMCHGLEVRTPFADTRIWELAARLPLEYRIDPSPARRETCVATGGGRVAKPVLKRLLSQTFPNEFVYRNKQGFAIPETQWLQPGTPVRRRLDKLTDDRTNPLFQYFCRREVVSMVSRLDQRGSHAGGLWSLVVLGEWFDQSRRLSHHRAA